MVPYDESPLVCGKHRIVSGPFRGLWTDVRGSESESSGELHLEK